MKITVKLFAHLQSFLPAGSREQTTVLEVPGEATVGAVIDQLGVPRGHCHLVLINGFYTPPGEADGKRLDEGDALAIWPPIAGG